MYICLVTVVLGGPWNHWFVPTHLTGQKALKGLQIGAFCQNTVSDVTCSSVLAFGIFTVNNGDKDLLHLQ